jgi:hypothetical protein
MYKLMVVADKGCDRAARHISSALLKVPLAAIKGDKTLAELAQQFDVHPNQLTDWKMPLQERVADVFLWARQARLRRHRREWAAREDRAVGAGE